MQTMPNYLANIGYRNPDSHVPLTPARYAFGCEFWEHLSKNPEKQADFDSSMKMSDMAPSCRTAKVSIWSKSREAAS
jgi:hypothetical protein